MTRAQISFVSLFLCQSFVIEVKTRGGSKYLIYRRYREFFNLHQILESKYSPEDPERPGPNTCVLPSLPGEREFTALITAVACRHITLKYSARCQISCCSNMCQLLAAPWFGFKYFQVWLAWGNIWPKLCKQSRCRVSNFEKLLSCQDEAEQKNLLNTFLRNIWICSLEIQTTWIKWHKYTVHGSDLNLLQV